MLFLENLFNAPNQQFEKRFLVLGLWVFSYIAHDPVREIIFMILFIGIENSKRIKWALTLNTLKYKLKV